MRFTADGDQQPFEFFGGVSGQVVANDDDGRAFEPHRQPAARRRLISLVLGMPIGDATAPWAKTEVGVRSIVATLSHCTEIPTAGSKVCQYP